jgi:hypothetical protein
MKKCPGRSGLAIDSRGLGLEVDLTTTDWNKTGAPTPWDWPSPLIQYAPEDKSRVAAHMPRIPLKGPAQIRHPPLLTFGVEGNVYFFPVVNSTITGIPGGPFGTTVGNDSFSFRDNYMFTAGGVVTVRIAWA